MSELAPDDYERLVQGLKYCVLIHDAVTKDILWANNAASTLLEFSVDELKPLKAPDMSAQEQRYRRSIGRAWLQAAVDNGVAVNEWAYRAKSGRIVLTEAIAVRVELSSRTVVMVQFRDIEREAHLRSDLYRTEARLAAFLRNMAEGILVLDDSYTITYASESAATHLASTVDSLIGAQFTEFCRPGASRRGVEAALARTSRDGDAESMRYEVELPNGEFRWYSASVQHIEIEDDLKGSLLLFHDVTEHIQTEQEHLRDAQYLNYLARYNAMGDMAMAIAHELGQPLAAATNFIAATQHRLGQADGDPKDLSLGLANARKQLDRANQIVRSLRAYVTQLEQPQQRVDLNEILEECAYFIDLRAKEAAVTLEYPASPQPAVIVCERVLTGQVVLNLCFNAIDEMANWPRAERTVRISTRIEDGTGVFSVADAGKGLSHIPDARIFDGAFTDKATGHGIGLALSHRIITRQGGTITARENSPRGAIFEFALPLAR
ncbi:two-component system sensor kinase FixL [Mycobacterium frederiksbergense]|uniref:histidine kinase n=1 Tax=Mycolicibacterium frederiksbergense TaxID=117567 RepID=A0ABT6KVG1_9MYCO|nr:ATP-binding protein [Mycolicibacterium frederiksbergense]MDH6194659.1 two-component system sensor kinase FixL [Mycolicibacterium frederiksbergense]